MRAEEVMVRCAATNLAYMRATPAAHAGYGAVVRLYSRLAEQGLACARAWERGESCPPHEPAVDAFWWGVAAWSGLFCADLVAWLPPGDRRLFHYELQEVFCRPHREFAERLRPLEPSEIGRVFGSYWPRVDRPSPAQIILRHDAAWTRLVISLAARWGLRSHLKDLPALWQSLLLVRRLERWPDPVARAFLESDVAFFQELFGHFPFSAGLRVGLECFLAAAREEAGYG